MSESSSEWTNTNSGDMLCRRDGLVIQRDGSGHWDKTENWHDSGKNWSNVLYLQTPPLEDDVGTLCISTEAKDQGWGNTNYSRVMVSVWKDSNRIASAKFDTVSYNWKRTDKKWSINSEASKFCKCMYSRLHNSTNPRVSAVRWSPMPRSAWTNCFLQSIQAPSSGSTFTCLGTTSKCRLQ